MKILIVSLHFVEYAAELGKALSHKNDVHIVFAKRKVAKTLDSNLEKILGKKVNYTLLDHYNLKNPKLLKNFFIITKLLLTFKPDIIHHQFSRDSSNLFFILFSWLIPIVGTLHDIYPHQGIRANPHYRSILLRMIAKFIKKYCYKKIIVHGDFLKKQLAASSTRNLEDIFVVPHGCLFSFLIGGTNRPVKEEEHTVLFFGRIFEYKGLHYLIEAEKIISKKIFDFKIIIAGTGDDLEKHMTQLDGNKHFEIHNYYIPNEKIPTLFYRSALIIIPYIEASQSGVIAMAYAFGKPVVVSDVGSLPEIVQNDRTGLIVPPKDPGKLAEAVQELLMDQDKRKKMGSAALEMANTSLSWEHVAELTQKVYKRVVD
jgi:glycosyltransferase involved in cell wall biosynthesis